MLTKGYDKRGADKSLARPGRKQATVTKLGIYATYAPTKLNTLLSPLLYLLRATQKNSEGFPSNQVSAAAMTCASDEKWRTFNCFFQSRKQVVVRRGQIRRIGWVSKTLETQVGQFFSGLQVPGEPGHCRARTRSLRELTAAFFLQNVLQLHQQR